jgi:hypothetical protein
MTQGSLANIYLNAMNKTLLASYDEVPSTYQQWVRQAASVADLKPVNRIRLGEFPSPEKVMRLGDYPQISAGSSKQSYSVEKQGFIFSLAWEDLVNDDLDALSKTPMMMGMAMRRAINYDAYAVLAGNLLADGTNIFTTANGNGANNSIAEAGMNAAFAAMRTQGGLNDRRAIGMRPRFIIVPAALEATAKKFFGSYADLAANANEGVINIYGPGQENNLQIIVDPDLDGFSTAIWYVAAEQLWNGVEITFLQGEESPVLEDDTNIYNDSYAYKMRQTYAIKAIDYRGLYRGGTTVS